MKTKYLLCVLLILIFNVSSYSNPLTTKYLFDGEWEWHEKNIDSWSFFTIKFTSQKKMEVVSHTYGFDENQSIFNGKFSIIDDQTINGVYEYYSAYDNLPPVPNFKPKQNIFTGKIVILDNSVQYDIILKFDTGVTLINRSHIVPGGLTKTIDGIKVITMGCKTGIINDNAKIRIKPSIDSDTIKYSTSFDAPTLQYCPKDSIITVLARTENKEKIKNWNNYWFYVELTDASEYEKRYGWIYSEFITIK
jgi:hypothetical protein